MSAKWLKIEKGERKNLVGIIILSIVIATCMFTFVNRWVASVLPKETVEVVVLQGQKDRKAQGNEIWLTGSMKNVNEALDTLTDSGKTKGNWEYRDAVKCGYSENMLVSYGENKDSKITLHMLKSPDSYIKFWMNGNAGVIGIVTDGKMKTYDLYSDVIGGKMQLIYPFGESNLALLLKAFAYGVLSLFVFMVILGIYLFFRKERTLPKFLSDYEPKRTTGLLFLLIFLYDSVKYSRGIPNFLVFGDQSYYWNQNPIFLHLNLSEVAKGMPSFRGYLSNVAPWAAQGLETFTGIPAGYFYMVFISAVAALFLGYVLPKLYEILTGRKAHNYQILLFVLIFSFFWRGIYYAVLMDLVSTTCYFTFVLFILLFMKQQKKRYAFGAGLMITSAVMYRLNYAIFFKLFAVTMLLVFCVECYQYWKKYKGGERKKILRKQVNGALVFVVAVLIVATPQILINSMHHHAGVFPYDERGAWGEADYTLTEFSASFALNSFAGYPYVCQDSQIQQIRAASFSTMDETLHMSQILYAYGSMPLDAVHTIIKKAFAGFDVKIHLSYPTFGYGVHSGFYLFSMLNYLTLGSAVYILLNRKLRELLFGKKELILFAIVFLILILPQTFVHIEWRYFLPGYVMFYYMVAYGFSRFLSEKNIKEAIYASNYFVFIGPFCILAHMISLSLYY